MKPVAEILLVVFVLAISVTVSAGDALYPEQRTIGDYNRENFAQLLMAHQQAIAAVKEYNEEMRAARLRFFTTKPNSPEHKAAEIEFASKLTGKDFFFVGPCITNGFSDGMARLTAASLLTAPTDRIDGGIQNAALPAFAAWVNAIRKSLGARNERDLLLVGLDSSAASAAINANMDAYATYKRERDKAEFVEWSRAHPSEIEVSGPPPAEDSAMLTVRLVNQGLYLVKFTDPIMFPVHPGVRNEMDPEDQQMLICIYSQISTPAYSKLYPRKYYWYKSTPKNIQHIREIDRAAFKGLIAMPDQGLEACPESVEASRNQFQTESSFYGPTRLTNADEQSLYLRTACHASAVQKLKAEEGDFKAMLANEVEKRYVAACVADKTNLTAAKIYVDLGAMCSTWNSELSGVRASRPSPKSSDAAILASYDRQCGGVSTAASPASSKPDLSTSTTTTSGSSTTPRAVPATSPSTAAKDAQAQRCAQLFASLEKARAQANGLRELIGVKSMELSVYRQCGKP